MPNRLLLFKGAEAGEAARPQQRLPLPDSAAHEVGAVGVGAQGNDLSPQPPVHPQPLFIRQRRIAPVGVQLDAKALADEGAKNVLNFVLKAVKGQV